jgi:hypothetical protein
MLNLSNIDIININCVEPEKSAEILKLCTQQIQFGRAILFTDGDIEPDGFEVIKVDKISLIEQYSDFCLQLNKFLSNDYVLIVQNDGFITNPEMWSNEFLNYDYIGAPWNQTYIIGQRVGNGGFSLRSKKFLEFSSLFETTEGYPEDNFLCLNKYYEALNYGLKYAPLNVANNFAYEYPHPLRGRFEPEKQFGFHGKFNINEAEKYCILKNQEVQL